MNSMRQGREATVLGVFARRNPCQRFRACATSTLDGLVAVVTIDHPPMNALSAPLLEELEAEIDRLDADDAVRAIVLVGAGERAFVAGADI